MWFWDSIWYKNNSRTPKTTKTGASPWEYNLFLLFYKKSTIQINLPWELVFGYWNKEETNRESEITIYFLSSLLISTKDEQNWIWSVYMEHAHAYIPFTLILNMRTKIVYIWYENNFEIQKRLATLYWQCRKRQIVYTKIYIWYQHFFAPLWLACAIFSLWCLWGCVIYAQARHTLCDATCIFPISPCRGWWWGLWTSCRLISQAPVHDAGSKNEDHLLVDLAQQETRRNTSQAEGKGMDLWEKKRCFRFCKSFFDRDRYISNLVFWRIKNPARNTAASTRS